MAAKYRPLKRGSWQYYMDLAGKAMVRDDYEQQEYFEEKARELINQENMARFLNRKPRNRRGQ